MVTIGNIHGAPRFIITAKVQHDADTFTLYALNAGGWERLGKGNSSTELEKKYVDFDKLRKE